MKEVYKSNYSLGSTTKILVWCDASLVFSIPRLLKWLLLIYLATFLFKLWEYLLSKKTCLIILWGFTITLRLLDSLMIVFKPYKASLIILYLFSLTILIENPYHFHLMLNRPCVPVLDQVTFPDVLQLPTSLVLEALELPVTPLRLCLTRNCSWKLGWTVWLGVGHYYQRGN